MSDFNVRALEIHSINAWDFRWVMKTINFMKKHQMTTLVLHRNDFIDLIVYPGKYFGCKKDKYNNIFERYQEIFRDLYKYTPTRRSGPYHRRAYLKRVLEEAKRAGINVFIQNKELYFPEIILEFYPHLVKSGKICPNEPFWWDFTKTKYTEFFEEFPEISGIITAPATGESRVSISSNRCTCDICRNTSKSQWYKNLIMSMYEPVKAAGKTLVIRDFVFNAEAHNEIASTMEQLPDDIIMSLKNTPHDYYPTFPDNTRIGNVGHHAQWIEFDAMGQYFGWGIGPSIMIDDMKRRMKFAKERGADGVIIRTDWESLDANSAFDTPNYINLLASSIVSRDLEAKNIDIYQKWIEEQGFYKQGIGMEDKNAAAAWVGSIMDKTWDVIKRTVYVNDCVFSDSSLLPVSLEHALWLAEEKNSLKDWDKSKANALGTEVKNVLDIMAEKDEALGIVEKLTEKVRKGNHGITPEGYKYLLDRFEIFTRYVKTFRIATHAIILTKYLLDKEVDTECSFRKEVENILKEKFNDMAVLAEELEEFYKTSSFQHTVYTLLDPERLITLRNDLVGKLNNL